MKNKRGLSGIVTAVIMIVLVMAAAAIVWAIVNRTIKDQMESSEACFGNYNKVTLNGIYTCYDDLADTFQFSLSIGDVDVNEVVVSVSSAGSTNSYTLTNTLTPVAGLVPYPAGSGNVILPAKNAGLSYVGSGFASKPDLVQIAPIIGGQQCEISDSISNIEPCF